MKNTIQTTGNEIILETRTATEIFLRSRQAKGLSQQTIRWYKGILSGFSEMYPALPENPEALENFLMNCTGGDERRHGYFRTLRVFYRFLERRYKVANPVNLIDAPKRKRKKAKPITIDELDQLLSFPHPARITAAIMFMADCGARIGETASLKLENIVQNEYGFIARIDGKTGERIVPISEATYRKLVTVLPFNINANRLCRLVSQAFREAHVKGTGHCIRHTFGTYWKGDRHILKEIMGHSSISTTELYSGILFDENSKEHQKYSPLKLVMSRKQLLLPF